MSGNRSLDEFGGAGAGESADDGEASGDDRVDARDVEADDRDPDSTDVGDAGGGETDTGDVAVEDVAVGGEDVAIDDEDASVEDAVVDPETGSSDVSGDADADDGHEPPASTYVWRPGGGTCAGCGGTAEERWRDGEDLVCAGCKEW